ncbi:hypothetical protein KY312_00670, partial [Candidatus Woesearchaeota archaeon]|nr:hypothetical protein [Candidatus Woesearchaeota archaeon]
TARPDYSIQISHDWLKENGVYGCFKGFYSSGIEDKNYKRILNKQEICQEYCLDVLVDDDARHLKKIQVPSLKRILIKVGSNEYESNGIFIASSWNDVVDEIIKNIY